MRVSAIACRSLQLAFRMAPWRAARNHRKARVEPLSTLGNNVVLGTPPVCPVSLGFPIDMDTVDSVMQGSYELKNPLFSNSMHEANVIGPFAWNGPTIFNSVAMDRILCLRRKWLIWDEDGSEFITESLELP